MPKITHLCMRIFQKYRRKHRKKKIPRKSVLSPHFFVRKNVDGEDSADAPLHISAEPRTAREILFHTITFYAAGVSLQLWE
ncbi:MAG: hypothetical protein IK060_06545, partial [Methanomicrobium sp.]|nr:hypothetical protein [Methanomicrobium sp.]